MSTSRQQGLFPFQEPSQTTHRVGFRSGAKGTHTSRTIMFEELSALLHACPATATRKDYAAAIIDLNCLGKPTASSRRLTNQRLGELYALDPAVPVFRIFRRLWDSDTAGRRLLAVLCALARDPLLAATAPAIIVLPPGADLAREPMTAALREAVGERVNDDTLGKVMRNAASSWTQAGHLMGRTFKKRRRVEATPASVAYGLYLAHCVGFRGAELFSSGWIAVQDCSPPAARHLAIDAKRVGLLDLRMAGDVVELNLDRLDPANTGT